MLVNFLKNPTLGQIGSFSPIWCIITLTFFSRSTLSYFLKCVTMMRHNILARVMLISFLRFFYFWAKQTIYASLAQNYLNFYLMIYSKDLFEMFSIIEHKNQMKVMLVMFPKNLLPEIFLFQRFYFSKKIIFPFLCPPKIQRLISNVLSPVFVTFCILMRVDRHTKVAFVFSPNIPKKPVTRQMEHLAQFG